MHYSIPFFIILRVTKVDVAPHTSATEREAKLAGTGAQGFVPKRMIYGDFFQFDEQSNLLVGQRSGFVYKLGDSVKVKLKEADTISTSMIFQLEDPCRLTQLLSRPERSLAATLKNLKSAQDKSVYKFSAYSII